MVIKRRKERVDTIKHAGRKSREKERRKRKAVKMFKINCTAKGEIEKAKETNAHERDKKIQESADSAKC